MQPPPATAKPSHTPTSVDTTPGRLHACFAGTAATSLCTDCSARPLPTTMGNLIDGRSLQSQPGAMTVAWPRVCSQRRQQHPQEAPLTPLQRAPHLHCCCRPLPPAAVVSKPHPTRTTPCAHSHRTPCQQQTHKGCQVIQGRVQCTWSGWFVSMHEKSAQQKAHTHLAQLHTRSMLGTYLPITLKSSSHAGVPVHSTCSALVCCSTVCKCASWVRSASSSRL